MFKKKNNKKPKTRGMFSLERHIASAYVYVCQRIYHMISYSEEINFKDVAKSLEMKEKVLEEKFKKGEIAPFQLYIIMDLLDLSLEEKYEELEKKESEVKDA